jgi:hypothetical protein
VSCLWLGISAGLGVPALGAQELFVSLPPAQCEAADSRIPVLMVGSYHMSNPGRDQFNLEADDVLAPQRQAEIRAVVDALAAFEPTKVVVEAPWADSATYARWEEYVGGDRELRDSEEEQIGFRLAHQLGHETIHPIDVSVPLDDEALGPLVGQNPAFQQKMGELNELGQSAMRIMGEWLAEGSVGEMLYKMNRPESIEWAHVPYVGYFVPIVSGDSYAGADMVADWYKRNLRIFANLTRIAESGDRIFAIYGQGHIKILRDLVIESPDFCLTDPLPYLK